MHYYTRNLGDYAKDTVHLTTLQHGIYSRLMDFYYTSEKPIPARKAARIAGVSEEEVQVVLDDFFELSDDGTQWRHKRIDQEISAYHERAERNRENGKKGGRKPKKNPVGSESVGSGVPKSKANRKPETGNQEDSPQAGSSTGKKVTLEQFIANLGGEKAFKPDDPIFSYGDDLGLPASFIKLAWLELQQVIDPKKKYVDWRAAFRNYVRGNWLKLWYEKDDEFLLTTAGKQAWKVHMRDEL